LATVNGGVVAAGAILGLLGNHRRSVPGMLIAGVGGALIYRGISGYCPLCTVGIDTAHRSGDELDTTEREINERAFTSRIVSHQSLA
jgi:uncharacterized membrane protein